AGAAERLRHRHRQVAGLPQIGEILVAEAVVPIVAGAPLGEPLQQRVGKNPTGGRHGSSLLFVSAVYRSASHAGSKDRSTLHAFFIAAKARSLSLPRTRPARGGGQRPPDGRPGGRPSGGWGLPSGPRAASTPARWNIGCNIAYLWASAAQCCL